MLTRLPSASISIYIFGYFLCLFHRIVGKLNQGSICIGKIFDIHLASIFRSFRKRLIRPPYFCHALILHFISSPENCA